MNRLSPERPRRTGSSDRLDHVLAAVIDRARRAIRAPAMRDAEPELRRIFALGLRCQKVARRCAVRAGPAGATREPDDVLPLGAEGAETLAREAGATVTVARHTYPNPGERAPEAMEQAFLLTRMGFLAAEAGRADPDGDPLGGFVWDEGAPMGRTALPGGRTATLVAARPSAAGRGLGVASVCRRAGTGRLRGTDDMEIVLTLLVPGPAGDGDPYAWLIELRTVPR
ncbi:MAG: hypothetical protein ABFS86_12275 [Planctomycetota bacterium]